MVHLEQRPATPPDADNLEPTRIGAEQRVELLIGAGTEAAHQDVRHALALEVGPVLRRRRADAGAAAVRVHVEGDAAAARVQPDESLVVRRQYRASGEALEGREELREILRDTAPRRAPPAVREARHLHPAPPHEHHAAEHRDMQAEQPPAAHQGHGPRGPDEREPGEDTPDEPVRSEEHTSELQSLAYLV